MTHNIGADPSGAPASLAADPGNLGRWTVHPLLPADITRSLDHKNLDKPVLARRLLDNMESDLGWVASNVVSLSYTTDRSHTATRSLRFTTLLRNPDYIKAARASNGTFNGQAVLFEGTPFSAAATLRFDPPQDWSAFNRLSLWCFVHPTDNSPNAVSIQFLCDGAPSGPGEPIAIHYFNDLKVNAWNHLVWEIPEFARDAVSEFAIFQPTWGVTGSNPRITYDFDALELQEVEAEVADGWAVPPGTIAYSHLGYRPAAPKIAITAAGTAEGFDILGADGSVRQSFPAAVRTTARGSWRTLDFSEFTHPGVWQLRYENTVTAPFSIGEAVWRPLIEATLNAYYGLRCGWAIPGGHGICHTDVFTEHDGERRSVEGGWHDAANLTQGPGRTHLSIYALCELADALRSRSDFDLADRAEEEARWGVDWSLRMRFGAGLRCTYDDTSYYTDSQVGTDDDVLQEGRGSVREDEFQNILAILAMARAARTFAERDPSLAQRLRVAAEEDFKITYEELTAPDEAEPVHINLSSWRDRVGYLCLAAVELFHLTGAAGHADAAVELGRMVSNVQERRFIDGIPVTGYFYEDPNRTRIVHEYHDGFEDSGLLAMAALRDTFPDHEDWVGWHTGLTLYAEYFCKWGSRCSSPFDVVPAAVWRRADIDAPIPTDFVAEIISKKPTALFPTPASPEVIRDGMMRLFEEGVDLGADYRLRVFPLWYDKVRHGSTTVHLGKVIGLSAVAAARADLSNAELAVQQLEWIVGRNPFSRSLIYGVGHDWWQNFSVELPNLVGGLSLGFNSYSADAPAWGNNAVFPYKEQWVYASSRIALLLSRIGHTARLSGEAPVGATFRNVRTNHETQVQPGQFDVLLAGGEYELSFGQARRRLILIHGADAEVHLDPQNWIEIDLRSDDVEGRRLITTTFSGVGVHDVELRSYNLAGIPPRLTVTLSADTPAHFQWNLEVAAAASPWLVVAIPDQRVRDSKEIFGTIPPGSREVDV